jgi:hypothetical protein
MAILLGFFLSFDRRKPGWDRTPARFGRSHVAPTSAFHYL